MPEDDMEHVTQVLSLLHDAGLRSDCSSTIDYLVSSLGYVIWHELFKVSFLTIDVILELHQPIYFKESTVSLSVRWILFIRSQFEKISALILKEQRKMDWDCLVALTNDGLLALATVPEDLVSPSIIKVMYKARKYTIST